MKKVCQLLAGDVQQIGGLESHVLSLSKGLAKDYQVCLVAHPNIRPFVPEGVEFIALDLSRGRYSLTILFFLWRLLRQEKFDIVHAHANKACSIVASLRYFCRFNFVATLHGQKKRLRSYGRADHVIAVSGKITQKIGNDNLTVIYNGIDRPEPIHGLRALLGVAVDDYLFCAAGRLVPVKGFDLLLRAFADVPAKLVILGDGPEKENLKALASSLGIDDKVFFPGFIDAAARYFVEVDTVVISSYREGFSYTFAEALLSDRLLISTDVADIRKFLPPGFLVSVGDQDALSEKMRTVVANKAQALQEFEPVFSRAQKEFSLQKMVAGAIGVYESLD